MGNRSWRGCVGTVVIGVVAAACAPARADDYTKAVNNLFPPVAAELRSDSVILPLAAKLEQPPAPYRTPREAALLGHVGPEWAAAVQWVQKPAQTELLDGLAKVTKEGARSKAFAFAQRYGAEVDDLDLVSKGMYTELGDPQILSAAQHLYLPRLDLAGVVVQVEASRLGESGKVEEAVNVLTNWMWFCRQMADRPFLREKRWGLSGMELAAERIRDVIYQDIRGQKRSMLAGKVLDANKRLKDQDGFLAISRIKLPEAEFIAREQLASMIMGRDGRPNPDTFGPIMARTAASERPLRLFSAAAFWDGVRAKHADAKATNAAISALRNDWERRWNLGPFERLVLAAGTYEAVMNNPGLTSIQAGLPEIHGLFGDRLRLRTELAGTRASLGVYGYWLQSRSWPVGVASASPSFMQGVDADPYSQKGVPIEFFVPMRDTPKGPSGEPKPHDVLVQPMSGTTGFSVPLNDSVFVIYSVGPDNDKGNAVRATQSRVAKPGEPSGDYLLFPPVLSLERQRLKDLNQLN